MRLFYGLSLPDPVREEAKMRAQDAARVIPGRYVPAENYHVTLAFLGEVPPERMEEASSVLARTLSGFPAPRLSLGGVSFFGRAQNAILVLRVLSRPSLQPLHDALLKSLAAQGLPFDPGPFSPHITLARHAVIAGDALMPLTGSAMSFTPRQAHVFLSARSAANQLCYTPVCSVRFPF